MENDSEHADRIRKVIEEEKKAALRRFKPEEFRSRLISRLSAGEAPLRTPSASRSPWALFRTRPLAAASLAFGFVALLAGLWFLILAPSFRGPGVVLEENIFQVLRQSSSQKSPAVEPAVTSISGETSPPLPVTEREIPLILYEVLDTMSTIRPALDFHATEEERASPAADRSHFEELLKRIKEV